MEIIKLLTQELSIGAANNVNLNQLVRVVNPSTSNNTLLVQYANGTTYSSTSVLGNSAIYIQKQSTDLLVGTGMYASGVAFK